MLNFIYWNPVQVVFGHNSITELPKLVPDKAKILMTYGTGSIKKNGVYEQVTQALKGYNLIEFGGIEPNPFYETCLKAVDVCKREKVDFLLAVGGGSVLDATKFIAAAVPFQDGEPWNILSGKAQVTQALPLGAVMTIPATGSEMNCLAVISRAETQEKLHFGTPAVYPKFSVIDPAVTFSLPKKQLVNGIVDAFVHVLEQYVTYPVITPLQDRQAEAILHTIIESAPSVLADRMDYNARANFVWCATQALNGHLSCGVVPDFSTHMIGHELTAFFGLDHAQTLAIVLFGVWQHQIHNKAAKLAQYAERVWGITSGSDLEKAELAIEKTEDFFNAIGMATRLRDYNIGEDGIDKVVKRFIERNITLGENKNITAKEVKEILSSRL
ncbi:MAG: iron-containing alcohol dehydrogenase [Deltaproteobacteria bacterium]|nr:iron-containing alcohol dehydrogenase [Deltaproteobacteria bacterium]